MFSNLIQNKDLISIESLHLVQDIINSHITALYG